MWTMCLLKIVVLRNCDDSTLSMLHIRGSEYMFYSPPALHVQGGPSGRGQPFVDIEVRSLFCSGTFHMMSTVFRDQMDLSVMV